MITAVEGYRVPVERKNGSVYKPGCSQCVINLPAKSRLITNQVLALPDYQANGSPDDVRYIVNRPLVSHFFSEKYLQIINGDTLLNQLPIFTLPDMKLERSNLSKFVAEDRELKLELSRVIDDSGRNRGSGAHRP